VAGPPIGAPRQGLFDVGDEGGERQLGTVTGGIANRLAVVLDVPVSAETRQDAAMGAGPGSAGPPPPDGG
jgi:hypothetical protein